MKGYLAVVVVLREVDGPLERFYCHLLAGGVVEGVVDTSSHALAYLLYCLEGVVKTQLHHVFPS